jgi:hypothetical protein
LLLLFTGTAYSLFHVWVCGVSDAVWRWTSCVGCGILLVRCEVLVGA